MGRGGPTGDCTSRASIPPTGAELRPRGLPRWAGLCFLNWVPRRSADVGRVCLGSAVSPPCGAMASGLCSSPRPGLASRSPLSMLFLRLLRVPPSHFLFGRPPTSSPCRGPSPSPTPPLLCTRFGTASFWRVQALLLAGIGSGRPDGRSRVVMAAGGTVEPSHCGTPETGQCGEDQRHRWVGPAEGPGTSEGAPG